MVVFAKSSPIETLFDHTNKVLIAAKNLRETYGNEITKLIPQRYREVFWDALFLACKVHDLGKIQSLFQNKILKASKKPLISIQEGLEEVPHNIISPAFIYNHIKLFPIKIQPAIYQAIAFHHKRGNDEFLYDKKWRIVIDVIKKDIVNRMTELEDMQNMFEYQLLSPSSSYLRKLQEPILGDEAIFYLFLKGFLHRADHSASAHLPIELDSFIHSSINVKDYLQSKNIKRDQIWQIEYTNNLLNQNVILQAGTGSGKTEFALYWIGKEKAFYTLPMRTSVNAMYERIKKTYKSENIGLLHSDSMLYVLNNSRLNEINNENDGLKETLLRIDTSKQLSMPISISTADQLITAIFKYPGYEKIFATLAYSKLVVDEIQSYDPEIVGIILKTLVDLEKIGCRFCIITATLPKIYLDYLKQRIRFTDLPPRFNSNSRHKIKMHFNTIDDPEIIDLIIDLNKNHNGVLVVVNTIKMAQRIKDLISKRNVFSSLLHSKFTYEDREIKENCLLKRQTGIWIATQLVEVSLDIDFDVMVTEISSMDSQVQRWGRVWRKRNQNFIKQQPNIHITSNPSDYGRIYDEDIVNLTAKVLNQSNTLSLSDLKEYELIQKVFDSEEFDGSKYKRKFDLSIKMLEEYNLSVDSKPEAQKLFRRISDITIIPSEVYDIYKSELDLAIKILSDIESKRIVKLNALSLIRSKSLSIPYYYLNDIGFSKLNDKFGITIANMKYSYEKGIQLENVSSAVVL